MKLEKKKDYIAGYVSQGISVEDAYTLVYVTNDERLALDADEKFQEEMSEIAMELTVSFLQKYNVNVDDSKFASDHYKRLQVMRKNVFAKDDGDKLPDLNINIIKQRPSE